MSDTQADLIVTTELSVEHTLDGLVKTGALQKTNQMDINVLLNPALEAEVISEMSFEEIFLAI